MNARKKAKEKKAVTHTWFTKVFSTRLSHSGKTRSQAMPQKQWKWIFLWHLVKLRMGSAISEVESTLLEIFIWILPGLQQQLWAILGKKKKNQDQVKEQEMCSCQGNDWKLQKRISISLGHVNLTLFTLLFHLQDNYHFSLSMSTSSWTTHDHSFWILLPTVITNRLPYFDINIYTKTKKHRSRLRFQPTARRMVLNGINFTKTERTMSTQTNFAIPGNVENN